VLHTSPTKAEFLSVQASDDGAIADMCVRLPQSAFFDYLFRMRRKAQFTPATTTFGDWPHRSRSPVALSEAMAVRYLFGSPEKSAMTPSNPRIESAYDTRHRWRTKVICVNQVPPKPLSSSCRFIFSEDLPVPAAPVGTPMKVPCRFKLPSLQSSEWDV
jgi:hypothetical protein